MKVAAISLSVFLFLSSILNSNAQACTATNMPSALLQGVGDRINAYRTRFGSDEAKAVNLTMVDVLSNVATQKLLAANLPETVNGCNDTLHYWTTPVQCCSFTCTFNPVTAGTRHCCAQQVAASIQQSTTPNDNHLYIGVGVANNEITVDNFDVETFRVLSDNALTLGFVYNSSVSMFGVAVSGKNVAVVASNTTTAGYTACAVNPNPSPTFVPIDAYNGATKAAVGVTAIIALLSVMFG